jgi:hypothetical protein
MSEQRGRTMNQAEEPMLNYQPETGRWSGANAQFSLWMDDATFRAYVASWVDWRQWLPHLPAAERQARAVAHCQRVRYWQGCERNYDRRVHLRYH